MSRKAKKAIVETPSTDPWQVQARGRKWSEVDITSIESILRTGKDPCVVTRVEYASITLMTISREDGRRHGWKWHRVDEAQPKFSTPSEDERPWCAFHGWKCGPTHEGCGAERVCFLTLCDCPARGHFHDCDAYLQAQQDKVDAKAAERKEVPVEAPVERHRKQERTGPVQMRLDIK